MGVNNLPKTVTRQRRGCALNPGPFAPESSTLTTRLQKHPLQQNITLYNIYTIKHRCSYYSKTRSRGQARQRMLPPKHVHRCMHAMTDRQLENIMPLSDGQGKT